METFSTEKNTGVSVDLRGIHRVFDGGVVAVDNLNLHIDAGEFIALLGPSGCGKTTVLRIIAGLDQPNSGTIQAGPLGPGRRAKIAYVFQDAQLLPWRNVLHNVELPLELIGISKSQRIDSA